MSRYVFLSWEFLQEAARRMREDEAFQEMARGFDDTVSFRVEAEPARGIDQGLVVGIDLPGATDLWRNETRGAGYTLTAPYSIFVDLQTGKQDPMTAITLGRIRMRGSKFKLFRYVKAVQAWLRVLQGIPTEFEGEYGTRSFG